MPIEIEIGACVIEFCYVGHCALLSKIHIGIRQIACQYGFCAINTFHNRLFSLSNFMFSARGRKGAAVYADALRDDSVQRRSALRSISVRCNNERLTHCRKVG